MKFISSILLFLLSTLGFCAVQSARISTHSKEEKFHHRIDPRYAEHDFAVAFEGLNPAKDGEATEDGVFGYPLRLIVESDEGCFLFIINNTEGVFSIYKLRKTKGGQFVARQTGNRNVRLPDLYAKLKATGLNILSENDLRRIHKLPREERKQFFRNYSPVK